MTILIIMTIVVENRKSIFINNKEKVLPAALLSFFFFFFTITKILLLEVKPISLISLRFGFRYYSEDGQKEKMGNSNMNKKLAKTKWIHIFIPEIYFETYGNILLDEIIITIIIKIYDR